MKMIWINPTTIKTWMTMMIKMTPNLNRTIRNKLKKDIIPTAPTKIQLLKKIMDLLRYKKIVLKSKNFLKKKVLQKQKLHKNKLKMMIVLKMN
jgi:hypothetical protein